MGENKKPVVSLSDKERFPLIDDLSFLNTLRQEHAPKFNFKSGDRLSQNHLKELSEYKEAFGNREPIKTHGFDWLNTYLITCVSDVPAYKNRPVDFFSQPTITRKDLHDNPWLYVSDEADLDDLLVYQTSGTTGLPMDVNFSPFSQASFIPQLESILAAYGIELSYASNQVAIALVCNQSSTLTYASLSTYLNGAGVLKINLNSKEWSTEKDRILYLQKHNPEILTGDPFSFLSLRDLNPAITPKALISSAMKLLPSVKQELEAFFQCPVIDVYSMTECRMLAYKVDEENTYKTIRHDLYFEVFDKTKDEKLEEGVFGELVVSGGNNPFLHLIRYRTGDFCRIKTIDGIQHLYDLEGRDNVVFKSELGDEISSVNVSRALAPLSLVSYTLHQNKGLGLALTAWTDASIETELCKVLAGVFGESLKINCVIKPLKTFDPTVKSIHYTSDL